jgi:hypothetical protein
MDPRTEAAMARVRLVSRVILVAGLVSGIAIWFGNADLPGAAGVELEETKQSLREMEVYGGKANVLATEFRHWFSGLWHGRSLGVTVVVLSVLAALVFRFLAAPLPPGADRGAGRDGEEP